MKQKIICVILFFGVLLPYTAHAIESTPFQLSLVTPIQLFNEETDVYFLRTNLILGKNKNVYGFDIGLNNWVTNNSKGIQMAYVVNATANMRGIQIGSLNVASDMKGAQLLAFANVSNENMRGIQVGLFNASLDMKGAQLSSFANISEQSMGGIQLGFFINIAQAMKGVQIGVINYAEDMAGVQIGFINVNKNGILPFFPIFNVGF